MTDFDELDRLCTGKVGVEGLVRGECSRERIASEIMLLKTALAAEDYYLAAVHALVANIITDSLMRKAADEKNYPLQKSYEKILSQLTSLGKLLTRNGSREQLMLLASIELASKPTAELLSGKWGRRGNYPGNDSGSRTQEKEKKKKTAATARGRSDSAMDIDELRKLAEQLCRDEDDEDDEDDVNVTTTETVAGTTTTITQTKTGTVITTVTKSGSNSSSIQAGVGKIRVRGGTVTIQSGNQTQTQTQTQTVINNIKFKG